MESEKEPEIEKMRLMTKVQSLLRNVHLGPVVLLFYICFGIFSVTSQQLYVEKACKVNLNFSDEICDNLNEHNETQIEAQKLISEIQVQTRNQFCLSTLISRVLMELFKVFLQSLLLFLPVLFQTNLPESRSFSAVLVATFYLTSSIWLMSSGSMS